MDNDDRGIILRVDGSIALTPRSARRLALHQGLRLPTLGDARWASIKGALDDDGLACCPIEARTGHVCGYVIFDRKTILRNCERVEEIVRIISDPTKNYRRRSAARAPAGLSTDRRALEEEATVLELVAGNTKSPVSILIAECAANTRRRTAEFDTLLARELEALGFRNGCAAIRSYGHLPFDAEDVEYARQRSARDMISTMMMVGFSKAKATELLASETEIPEYEIRKWVRYLERQHVALVDASPTG